MAVRRGLCLLLALLAGAVGQVDDDCVATALASATPGEAAADALSNAVAETLTTSVVCENGAQAQPGSVGGLSVAVALAISEANMIGQRCSADAEAAAEFASSFVVDELASEMLRQTDGDSERLATAWLTAQGPNVKAVVDDSPTILGEDGCLDLEALTEGLPQAVELGMILSDAVQQIIEAVQCGTNLQETEQECIWADRMFIGKCIGADAVPIAPAPEMVATDRSICLSAFGECRRMRGLDCTNTLKICLENARWCTFC